VSTDYTQLPERPDRAEHLTVSVPVPAPPPPAVDEVVHDPRFRTPADRFIPETLKTAKTKARLVMLALAALGVVLSLYPLR